MHSYQTHIFAPPVRKSNTTTGMASSLSKGGSSAGGSRYRLFYADSIIQETFLTHALARYKGIKCAEKWGLGPKDLGQFVTSQCSSLCGPFRFQCYSFNRSRTHVLCSMTSVVRR